VGRRRAAAHDTAAPPAGNAARVTAGQVADDGRSTRAGGMIRGTATLSSPLPWPAWGERWWCAWTPGCRPDRTTEAPGCQGHSALSATARRRDARVIAGSAPRHRRFFLLTRAAGDASPLGLAGELLLCGQARLPGKRVAAAGPGTVTRRRAAVGGGGAGWR
jgi:hypothetical protein